MLRPSSLRDIIGCITKPLGKQLLLDTGEIMRRETCKSFYALAVLTLSVFAALPVNAAIYNFSQDGYSGGGVITGWFDAIDTIGNGQISTVDGEVSDFLLSFSGDIFVDDFIHTFVDLDGLVYDIGSGFIGDGTVGDVEGMASSDFFMDYDYASGLGPLGVFGGMIFDNSNETMVFTNNMIVVTDPVTVPVPGAIWLSCSGLVGYWRLRRRKAV